MKKVYVLISILGKTNLGVGVHCSVNLFFKGLYTTKQNQILFCYPLKKSITTDFIS